MQTVGKVFTFPTVYILFVLIVPTNQKKHLGS